MADAVKLDAETFCARFTKLYTGYLNTKKQALGLLEA
jgi:hypothetical protein